MKKKYQPLPYLFKDNLILTKYVCDKGICFYNIIHIYLAPGYMLITHWNIYSAAKCVLVKSRTICPSQMKTRDFMLYTDSSLLRKANNILDDIFMDDKILPLMLNRTSLTELRDYHPFCIKMHRQSVSRFYHYSIINTIMKYYFIEIGIIDFFLYRENIYKCSIFWWNYIF